MDEDIDSGGFRHGRPGQTPGAAYLRGAANHMGGAKSSIKKKCVAQRLSMKYDIILCGNRYFGAPSGCRRTLVRIDGEKPSPKCVG